MNNRSRQFKFKRLLCICNLLSFSELSKEELIDKIEQRFDQEICESTFEKDLQTLRKEYDAPILYSRDVNQYSIVGEYDFQQVLLGTVGIA